MSFSMNRGAFLACLFAGLGAVFLPHAGPTHAQQVGCSTEYVVVDAPTYEDAADACEGAASAIKFLVDQGLNLPAGISISVVSNMPLSVNELAIGAYMRAERRVLVLTYAAFKERNYLFKGVPDRALYRAVVSHEVAHAIAEHNFKKAPSSLGQEYIAYVTLFSTVASSWRQSILQQYPYDSDWQVNVDSLYFVDPLGFGAQAYQHHLKPENGKAFIGKVLDGAIFADPQ